ncbi:PTS sugar transporter subunit IIA [Lacticaseibacillus daqingensis]|uniref:PTS sugar transporter subunit IIA n=1 Tax=Lacticaseibacillus daqingensis TaxID=2486014 RepID=UPI000F79CE25|nr:PTS sugar transporter subunit IIA [Lacticaseibacillus daqingensis]
MAQYQTIVTGHGRFATGMKGALDLLAGPQDTFTFIDFTEDLSEEALSGKLQAALTDTPTLIFTDLVGGTPYKEAAKLAFNRHDVVVVAGCNLASLLETIFGTYASLPDYANALVAVTQRSAQVLDLSDDATDAPDEDEDGI